MHGQGVVQPRDRVVGVGDLDLVVELLGRAGPQPVDAEPPRQLREPGSNRVVVPQLVQVLVGASEDLLEDVFCVMLRHLEALNRDRVDVAGEAVDQLAPGVVVAGAAPGDQLSVGQLHAQPHRLHRIHKP